VGKEPAGSVGEGFDDGVGKERADGVGAGLAGCEGKGLDDGVGKERAGDVGKKPARGVTSQITIWPLVNAGFISFRASNTRWYSSRFFLLEG